MTRPCTLSNDNGDIVWGRYARSNIKHSSTTWFGLAPRTAPPHYGQWQWANMARGTNYNVHSVSYVSHVVALDIMYSWHTSWISIIFCYLFLKYLFCKFYISSWTRCFQHISTYVYFRLEEFKHRIDRFNLWILLKCTN